MSGYQLLPPLSAEKYAALKADIAARGVMVPIEVDEDGAILDGHHRSRIAAELGIDPPLVVRRGMDEQEKRLHVLKLNLARRHLSIVGWGAAFAQLLETRGVQRGQASSAVKRWSTSATLADVAAEVGVPERTARHRLGAWESYRALPPPAQRRVESGASPFGEAQRLAKLALADRIETEPLPLPTGPFRVIVADPPWPYRDRADDATHRGHVTYPTMPVDEIAGLPVRDVAHDDAVLWLWTTNAFFVEAFEVCQAWGFERKTVLTWAKDRMGVGGWLRGQTEHCILGVRGRPGWRLTNQTTLLHAPRREHSRKPDEFYALVEALCPGSKLEMFAREARPGWALWGAEAPVTETPGEMAS